MIDAVNEFETHVGARLLDFFDSRSPWSRKLWNCGLVLTLSEVVEALEAVRAGVLSEPSLGYLLNHAQKAAGTDPGAGSSAERRLLQDALSSKPRLGGLHHHLIVQQEAAIRPRYLARWADVLRQDARPGPERTARSIASHFLDLGYSSDYLHRWWKYRLFHEEPQRPLADLVDDAQALALASPRVFEVLAPVSNTIRWKFAPPNDWREAPEVSQWLRSNGFEVAGVRQSGGFLFKINTLDVGAAVLRATEMLDHLSARMAVGTKHELALLDHVWVKGDGEPHGVNRVRRGVWVEALERENQLYDARSSGGIHAAIELLAHLQFSSPGAAVAGGWAAIEALLSEPDDRAGASERLAMLVACSFPRAELTRLSYALSSGVAPISAELRKASKNQDRCDIIAGAIAEGRINLSALTPTDSSRGYEDVGVVDQRKSRFRTWDGVRIRFNCVSTSVPPTKSRASLGSDRRCRLTGQFAKRSAPCGRGHRPNHSCSLCRWSISASTGMRGPESRWQPSWYERRPCLHATAGLIW